MKTPRVWVGFCDGKPYMERVDEFYDKTPFMAVFMARRNARKCFEDVCEFRLVPVEKKKGGRSGR